MSNNLLLWVVFNIFVAKSMIIIKSTSVKHGVDAAFLLIEVRMDIKIEGCRIHANFRGSF